MKKATFYRNQAEKFNKFLAKYEKARTRKGFNNTDMMFCKYKDVAWILPIYNPMFAKYL